MDKEYFPLSNFCFTKVVLIVYGSRTSILFPQPSYLYVVFNPKAVVVVSGLPNKSMVVDSIFPSGDVVLVIKRFEAS